jgi:hypothetical protein
MGKKFITVMKGSKKYRIFEDDLHIMFYKEKCMTPKVPDFI